MTEDLDEKARGYVERLCGLLPDRHVGGEGNRAATAFFADTAAGLGCEVLRVEFASVDWKHGDSWLAVGHRRFEVHPGPYSPPLDVTAPLLTACRLEDLEQLQAHGRILLLHGDIVARQLTPRAYPFYQTEGHAQILDAIERARPLGVVAATGRDPGLTGGLYPFPLLEDGDFEIPSAYMTDVAGEQLLQQEGADVWLSIDSSRIPSTAEQVSARVGTGDGRVVVSAHIDTKDGTPGALDNATGVAVLLVLAELLGRTPPPRQVELVPFNGEDNYAAPGEVAWLSENEERIADIALNINIDGAAWVGRNTSVSMHGCPEDIATTVRRLLEGRVGFHEGDPWPQGDHMVFAMRGVPAVAITSDDLAMLSAGIAHTERDVPELVNGPAVVSIARFIAELISALGQP